MRMNVFLRFVLGALAVACGGSVETHDFPATAKRECDRRCERVAEVCGELASCVSECVAWIEPILCTPACESAFISMVGCQVEFSEVSCKWGGSFTQPVECNPKYVAFNETCAVCIP